MNFIEKDKLPVEIKNNELPKVENKNYKMFYDYRIRTSGGFTSALFLSGIMITCLMWGMLLMLLIQK